MPRPRDVARTAILDGCERALAAHGYRRMTMEDVAEAARLARRTVYLHFPSKEALVAATMDKVVASTQQAMRQHLREGTGLESLRGMLTARILHRLEQVGPYHGSFEEIWRALYPHTTEDYVSYFEPEVELLIAALDKGAADRSIVLDRDPRSVAEVLVRATNGFMPSNFSRAEVANRGLVRKKLDIFVEMICRGVASSRAPRKATARKGSAGGRPKTTAVMFASGGRTNTRAGTGSSGGHARRKAKRL